MLKNVPKTVAKYYVRYQGQITSRILKSIVTWQFSYYLFSERNRINSSYEIVYMQ